MSVERGRPVLIGFAESLAAIESAWSLVDAGFEVCAFTRRGRRPPLRRSRSVRLFELTPPEEDAARAAHDLVALVAASGSRVVLPLDDHAVWLCNRAGDELGVPVAGPTGPQAELALDKLAQLGAAATAGFATPPTRACAAADASGEAAFPLAIKPRRAVSEHRGRLSRPPAHICLNTAELASAIAGMEPDEPVLVQTLVPGSGEGLFGIATEDAVLAWSAHRRIRMMNPRGSGSSACAAIPVDPGLMAPAERLLGVAGWRGIFMVELLRDDTGGVSFIELNGRAWGSMALARRRGLEYPAWAVRQALGGPISAVSPGGGPLSCRHVGRDIVHLLHVLRGPGGERPPGWPGRLRTAAAMLSPAAVYNHRRGELPVLLDDITQTVGQAVRRGAAP